jgi:hypothetical protein
MSLHSFAFTVSSEAMKKFKEGTAFQDAHVARKEKIVNFGGM